MCPQQKAAGKPRFREVLGRGLRFRCPNCGQGRIFQGWLKMPPECPRCGLSYYPESGYYVGAMYLDYMISAGIFLAVYIPSLFLRDLTHFSFYTKSALWVIFGALLCLALARPSYSLWLAMDFWITPWKPGAQGKEPEVELKLTSLTLGPDSRPGRGRDKDS